MSTAAGYADRAESAASLREASAVPPAQTKTRPGWLLGPWADLFFVANIAWPAVAVFAAMFAGTAANEAFGFLLAFFVIMPHRWITLPLVFCDRQKFADRPLAYLAVLGFVILLCSTIRLSMHSLALLVAIDYVWNAWHFSAQHSGILGIYSRLARPEGTGATKFEKYGMRVFFMYVLLRLTGMFAPEGSVPFLDWVHDLMRYVAWCDFAVSAIPLWFLVREAARFERRSLGRLVYMTSICTVYLGLLAGIRYELTGLIVGCAAATTLIHSSEYLSIVSWHVPKSKSLSQSAIFARLIPHWALFLFGFMAFFAVTSFFFRERYVETWIWINLNVSLLHYAYDGMIWKRPKKKAA